MILDAATLLSLFDRDDASHWSVTATIELAGRFENLTVSPFVIAELESIIRERFGTEGWGAVLEQLASGAWSIANVDARHLAAARELVARGEPLAAASTAVLARSEQ